MRMQFALVTVAFIGILALYLEERANSRQFQSQLIQLRRDIDTLEQTPAATSASALNDTFVSALVHEPQDEEALSIAAPDTAPASASNSVPEAPLAASPARDGLRTTLEVAFTSQSASGTALESEVRASFASIGLSADAMRSARCHGDICRVALREDALPGRQLMAELRNVDWRGPIAAFTDTDDSGKQVTEVYLGRAGTELPQPE